MINPRYPRGASLAESRIPVQKSTAHCKAESEADIAKGMAELRRIEIQQQFGTGRPPELRNTILAMFGDGKERNLKEVCAQLSRAERNECNSVRGLLGILVKRGELTREARGGVIFWTLAPAVTLKARLAMAIAEAEE